MAEGATRNPTIANQPADEDIGSDSGVESTAATACSLTCGTTLMAKGEISKLSNLFKKTLVTNEERQAYHVCGWLTGNILSSIL
jgi:predicted NACHT family NTPase